MKNGKYRDLTLSAVPGGTIVVSCDSCGGTGGKINDVLPGSAYITGRFTARGALMEMLCFGAEILTVVDAVCCEMEPTGAGIIRGFREEMCLAGIDPDKLTGSTEENFETSMTAVGTSVVGYIPGEFTMPQVTEGDRVLCICEPRVGAEILDPDNTELIVSYETIAALHDIKGVREIIPVGSKGILYEATATAELHHKAFHLDPHCPLDVHKSGGPSTCAIVVADTAAAEQIIVSESAVLVGWIEVKK